MRAAKARLKASVSVGHVTTTSGMFSPTIQAKLVSPLDWLKERLIISITSDYSVICTAGETGISDGSGDTSIVGANPNAFDISTRTA